MASRLANYWAGKSVLITGASSGLGEAVTEALAPFGIQFCLLSRNVEKLNALAARLENSGSTFWIRACDVRQREQVQTAVRDFHRHAGRLDVAWVNSGVSRDTSFERWDWETFENMVDTNLKGAIYTTISCLEVMKPQKSGAIVGLGSVASMRGLANRGVYSLTKISLHYFLESLAVELPEIQFTIIHPGFVDTPINRGNPNRIFLMQPAEAAQIMIRGVAKRKRVLIYPLPMKALYRLVRMTPRPLYYWLGRKAMRLTRPVRKG